MIKQLKVAVFLLFSLLVSEGYAHCPVPETLNISHAGREVSGTADGMSWFGEAATPLPDGVMFSFIQVLGSNTGDIIRPAMPYRFNDPDHTPQCKYNASLGGSILETISITTTHTNFVLNNDNYLWFVQAAEDSGYSLMCQNTDVTACEFSPE